RADRLRAGEIARHGNDEVALVQRLHVPVVVFGGKEALRLAGVVVRKARHVDEPAGASAPATAESAGPGGAAARRDVRPEELERLEDGPELLRLVLREGEAVHPREVVLD